MAIMDEAKIFLMDEPSAALDPKSAKNLMRKAQQIIQEFKLTCLLVTHDLKDAHQYGNRIIQMREGKIIKDLDQTQKQALQINDLFAWFT
jgi:putative ABC transport system ATP-binding protein